jgi:hypothetical protein
MVGLVEPETPAATSTAPALAPGAAPAGVLGRIVMRLRQIVRFAYEPLTNV